MAPKSATSISRCGLLVWSVCCCCLQSCSRCGPRRSSGRLRRVLLYQEVGRITLSVLWLTDSQSCHAIGANLWAMGKKGCRIAMAMETRRVSLAGFCCICHYLCRSYRARRRRRLFFHFRNLSLLSYPADFPWAVCLHPCVASLVTRSESGTCIPTVSGRIVSRRIENDHSLP